MNVVLPGGSSSALHQRARWPKDLVTAYEGLYLIDFWIVDSAVWVSCSAAALVTKNLNLNPFIL